MISLQIQDVKGFMSRLLLSSVFDAFLVVEGSVTTFNTFHIDGTLHPDFYTKDEQEELNLSSRRFSLWKELRPHCLELIRGKRTPLNFRFTFELSAENTEKLLAGTDTSLLISDVNGLILNIRYEEAGLFCTTGISLSVFTLDKSLEHAWDNMVQRFFLKQEISFSLL